MSTTAIAIPDHDVHLLLHDVPWEAYEQLREELDAERRHLRLTYDDGALEMMSPSYPHERWKKRIARLIELLTSELQIDIECGGSTTLRRQIRRKGLEPDECYYVQSVSKVRGANSIDLNIHPPPDLAVEVDYSYSSLPREPVYAGLGIRELWRFDGKKITIRKLSADGTYRDARKSSAFPFLPITQFAYFVHRLENEIAPPVIEDFKGWVRTLKR